MLNACVVWTDSFFLCRYLPIVVVIIFCYLNLIIQEIETGAGWALKRTNLDFNFHKLKVFEMKSKSDWLLDYTSQIKNSEAQYKDVFNEAFLNKPWNLIQRPIRNNCTK